MQITPYQLLQSLTICLLMMTITSSNLQRKKNYIEETHVTKLDNVAYNPVIHAHEPQQPIREFESEYERIKHAMFIENAPMPELYNGEQKNDDNSTLRSLADVTTLDKPGFINFNQGASTTKAYSYVLKNLRKSSSHFILYPFKFSYTPEVTPEEPAPTASTYEDGGVFTLKKDLLPLTGTSAYFQYLNTTTDVEIGKAKAIYDGDIAMLKLEATFEESRMDLFYESDSYCNFFVNFLGKYNSCLLGKAEYLVYKKNNPSKSALVYYNHTEILQNGLFDTDGTNLFSLLIVPDHVAGSENEIKKYLGDEGISMIKKFMDQGGSVLASGKSGYLFELWGVIAKGSYNTKYYLTSLATSSLADIKGCEDVYGSVNTESANFNKHLICMNNKGKTYLVTSYLMNSAKDMDVILSIDRKSEKLSIKRSEDGTTEPIDSFSEITEEQKNFLPFYLTKKINKGKLMVMNGNPLFKLDYPSIIYNIFFEAMAKNVIFNTFINFAENADLPIPGGEAGILLSGVVEFINLYNKPVNNFDLRVFIPNKVSFHSYDNTKCQLSTEEVEEMKNDTSMNHTEHLACKLSTFPQFETFKQIFKLEILDHSVTQKATDIPILYPIITFTDSETSLKTVLNDGYLKVQAALAAILRGALNPDPSSFYPLPSKGAMIDNVLQVENKENTFANEVVYHGVLPLISPVLDTGNQASIVRTVELYKKYYDDTGYTFPWTKTGEQDFIDYQELSDKNILIVMEWDQPTKISNVIRTETNPNFNVDDKINVDNHISDNPNVLLKQIYFKDSDLFFEHATQRSMPFVDTTKPKGAAAYYQGNIPEDMKDPDFPNQAKKNFLWSRQDVYFYPQEQFQMPTNVNKEHVISVDKYPKPNTDNCADEYGFAKNEKMVEGYFDSTKPLGLKPEEYGNVMWKYCFHKQINGTDQSVLSALSPDLKAMHYLVPVIDTELKRAGSLVGFTENADKSGFHTVYPSLQFIFGHKLHIVVGPEESRQGGKLEIDLSQNTFKAGVDPVADGYITYSADQVAFYKTEWFPTEKKVIGYFKRGLMPNEAYGKDSNLFVHFEKLTNADSFESNVSLYEVKYDVTSIETNYENYELRRQNKFTIEKERFFSLPAIEISTRVNRNGDSNIKEYELLAPYTRYGVYMQELVGHRTIWTPPESHHVSGPGLQIPNGGYSFISNIGISSIPFAEYVTHGSGLLIPSAPRTSRLEWVDIWGRNWAQPLRSIFPDIIPVPPPLKNFMMSTTFELLADNGKTRVLEWPSDEEVIVRVQMKFLNNYPKFFLPTICPKNRYPFFQKSAVGGGGRLHILPADYPGLKNSDTKDGQYHINYDFNAVYGECFKEEGAYLSGSKLTQKDFDLMDYAMLCGGTNDADKIKECADQIKTKNVKTLNTRVGNGTEIWNYSPGVEAFYPKDYIKPNMWDLTHYDYYDNSMDKAYKYHIDNGLPAIDAGPGQNPAYYKPHNIISFPIFKGFGYQMEYDKTFSLPRFSPYKGWWSDNLQNKDNTLLAGQVQSNDISVDQPSLLKDSDWVNSRQLINKVNPNLIAQRLKNIYVCMFNQHRVKMSPEQPRISYPTNVYQNYVVPVIPDLDENDDRLTKFDCKSDFYQYGPRNISQVDNRVLTPTDRDWLYFGLGLRGGARETINVLMKLKPFADRKYEGVTKVQDGGRFVYWNPVNGPNSFLMLDNNVNTVEAYRTDLDVKAQLYPGAFTTFKATIYQVHSIEDTNENREYPVNTYMNSYGFGDAAVTVYIGGTESTGVKVKRGEKTFVKISFYNNCGFDWNMYGAAIDFEEKGSMGINANDLLNGKVHIIQEPKAYHFLKINIPDELKPYVEFIPSGHNIDVPGQFFDFESINVVSIKDGFEGIYTYQIHIKADFPDKFRGKLLEIPVELLPEYFDRLPGHNDPTTSHDYTLKVPTIKFGVPDDNGKLYYTLGRVTDLGLQYWILNPIKVEALRFITEETLTDIQNAVKDPETIDAELLKIWDKQDQTHIPFTETVPRDPLYTQINANLSSFYPEFPLKIDGKFDITKIYLMSKSFAPQLEFGYKNILTGSAARFINKRQKIKTQYTPTPQARYGNVKGAWLAVAYKYQVVTYNEETLKYEKAIDQRVFATDAGVLQINVTAKNTGSDISYRTNFTLYLDYNVEVDESTLPEGMTYEKTATNEGSAFTLNTRVTISVRESYTSIFYIKFSPLSKLRALETASSRQVIQKVSAGISLKDNDDIQVLQTITTPLSVSYPNGGASVRETIDLTLKNEGTFNVPRFRVKAQAIPATTATGEDVQYIFYRRNPQDSTSTWVVISPLSRINEATDSPLTESQTQGLTQYNMDYRVETYNPNKGSTPIFLASSLVTYTSKLPPAGGDTDTPNDTPSGSITKEGFPLWAIIVIAVASFLIIGGLILFLVLYSKKHKKQKQIAIPDETSTERNVITKKKLSNKINDNNVERKYSLAKVGTTKDREVHPDFVQVSKFRALYNQDKSQLDKSGL